MHDSTPAGAANDPRALRVAARVLGAAVAATGAVALCGWFLGLPSLTTFGTGAIAMKANAAACLVALGLAAALASWSRPWAQRAATALGAFGALVGFLTLSEHLVGWDLGIDELLARDDPFAIGTVSPGRMGPFASTSFTALGLALVGRQRRRVAEALAIAPAFLSLLSIVGYAYGIHRLYTVARITAIALPTAIAIEALAAATLLVLPGSGLAAALARRTAGGRLARRAVAYATAIPLAIGWIATHGVRAGAVDGEYAIAFLALAVVFVLVLLSAREAVRYDRIDAERRRADEALRESDRRKSEFLAVLSHELRNPLAPIRNGLVLLARAPPGSESAERARAVIARQTEHLVRLVDDLLDMTRISRGRIELQRRRLDALELARRTCDDHRAAFERKGVALRLEGDAPAWVDADPTRLAQILGNLLQNAVKFTPAGGTTTVEVRAAEGRAELRVRDTGEGVADPQLLFEPFSQAAQGLARSQGGLGLGLAIVKGLVELHGGTVDARSEGAGRGAEFVVRLPLAAPPAAGAAAGAAPRCAPRSVLLVEDNADAARSLADLLALDGHRVEVAHDGRTGIARARELRPDAVVCDLGLPDVSGFDVARALRADAALAGTCLVALSGYAQPEDRARALEAGFTAHLAKPPSLEALSAILAGLRGP
jgi:two-component system CheB/CheR fusion protein